MFKSKLRHSAFQIFSLEFTVGLTEQMVRYTFLLNQEVFWVSNYFNSFFWDEARARGLIARGAVITGKHIMIECADLLEIRKKYFEERSLYSLFQNVIPEIIFDFLREIGMFYKIWSVLRKCLCEVFSKSCLNFVWNVLQFV